ncbi:conserved phage C-terminal domain-containing protein [Neobacillus drentensis]|uniref:conserved phage C-terminal domain-containing protein n=1 Tax=Neobacillus drentensis TaxID=220684 RepID=UPI000824C08C|nr:conserved phage C-terminal domain-containing protein [Neobacillus drentensis]
MSRLLIKENPVMIIPSLAVKIGLNEAVVLQQIHYWLGISKHQIEGRTWVYNTYEEWRKQLPFWSVSTIKRTIHSLEMKGLLLSANFNQMKMDKTKWYSIDYEKLQEHEDSTIERPASPTPDAATGEVAEDTKEMDVSLSVKKIIPFDQIIQYLNEKTRKNFRSGSIKTRELIQARYREGFTLEDFKRVIDLKSVEWQSDPNWNKFLRPETLFGTKFEAYLNQQEGKKKLSEEDFDLDD